MKKIAISLSVFAAAALVAAQAHAALLGSDTFTYPDGALTNVQAGGAAGQWQVFSGAPSSPLNVSNGQAVVSGGLAQDAGLILSTPGVSNGVIYASFDLTVQTQGTGAAYFALFKDATSSDLFSRVFLTNDGTSVRIGITDQGNVPVAGQAFDGDLTLGTTYKIVIRYDQTGTSAATLWVNPTLETDSSITATDVAAIQHATIVAFGLRQSNATQGTELVDNVLVGTTFGDVVVPEPSTVMLVGAGLLGLLAVRRRRS